MTQTSQEPATIQPTKIGVMYFDVPIAMIVGVEAAVLYKNIENMCVMHRSSNAYFKDGLYWMYNSVSSFTKIYPFWTIRQIRTLLDKLLKAGLILKGSFNKHKNDKTLWYAAICQNGQIDLSEMTNRFVRNDKPIPIINNSNNNIKESTVVEESKKKVFKEGDKEYQVATLLYEKIRAHTPKFRKPTLATWAEAIDLLARKDGVPFEDIEKVIEWGTKHEAFWQGTLLSAKGLRRNWDSLYVQYLQEMRKQGEEDTLKKPRAPKEAPVHEVTQFVAAVHKVYPIPKHSWGKLDTLVKDYFREHQFFPSRDKVAEWMMEIGKKN